MTVRAKLVVQRYETQLLTVWENGRPTDPREVRTIVMTPIGGDVGGEENKRFFAATPTGEVRLGTTNPEAWQQFELGKAYYLTFDPAGD